MKLGEVLTISGSQYGDIEALRVPGGWVYITTKDNGVNGWSATSCFVPYSAEFDNRVQPGSLGNVSEFEKFMAE